MQILLFIISALNLSSGAAITPQVVVKNENAIVTYFNSHETQLSATFGNGQVQQFEHLMSLFNSSTGSTGGANGGSTSGN